MRYCFTVTLNNKNIQNYNKMKKEEIYVNLQGKTKEELTDLWEFLTTNGEKVWRDLQKFIYFAIEHQYNRLSIISGYWAEDYNTLDKTEVTIDQLKQIIKPMETRFTPIAMRCTQEQFEAIKPKLIFGEGCIKDYENDHYLINNVDGLNNKIGLLYKSLKTHYGRTVHETWNEEIFLKACGIEVDSLEQQLQKAEAEVKRLQSLIEENNKPKVGDFVFDHNTNSFYKLVDDLCFDNLKKITNPELIKLLENECSTKN